MTKYHSLFLQLLDGMIMIHHRLLPIALYTIAVFVTMLYYEYFSQYRSGFIKTSTFKYYRSDKTSQY